ncbi:MAG: GAF domain-containing protein [Deltaproteobacteria bacterium]|nr:GAF domain-containing protein [Deltaproteobacteria bacterium]MDH3951173.1 GAF domain-containing protein [Deltaproteobacteria bacterium]
MMQEYGGTDRRGKVDRRSGWDRRKSKQNLSLLEMLTTHDIDGQCRKITIWLKQHYNFQGIGILLRDPTLSRPYFYADNVSEDILKDLDATLAQYNQTETTHNKIMFFSHTDGKIIACNPPEDHKSSEPTLLAIPLALLQHRSIGTLALVAQSAEIHRLTSEKQAQHSFVPLISVLLDNAFMHEQKDRKIRMLNLYQTVSSALGYIGDLQELLTTIVTIVTTELVCEEGSVLLHDEENNEFEFFTAVGETGQELVKLRFPADKGIAGRALRERRTIVVNDVSDSPDFYGNIDEEHDFKTESILAAPLISGEEVIGVIEAINKIGNDGFDQEDERMLLAIADEVALAVKNAKIFDYVVDSYCKIRQGLHSCKGCERPLKSWTPCVRQLDMIQ